MWHKKKRRNEAPTHIKGVLDNILKPYGIEINHNEAAIVANWKEIVGEKVAENSKPVSLKDKVLFLKIKNAVWRNQLFLLKSMIIKKINDYIKEKAVQDIHFSS